MADGARPALGLSIGATNLAAVTPDHAITRKPVLTLYRQRPPEVGVPSENPRLDEPGLVINDFVDRVGDRVGIVAADGSVHRSEALVADGLRALAYAATGGRALPDNVAVTYPAHWAPAAVDALGGAVSRVSEWSHQATPVTLIPDAAAALFAVRANPGIPARGTVAVCDFGGSGTSITLVDASADYQPLGPTVRHHDFSGDLVDQSLLSYVMSEMPGTGSFDPSATAAIGSLNRLRAACRTAKERLSATTVTTLSEAVPGLRGEIRLTRNELEETIRGSLDGVVGVLEESLRRNASGLVAIVTVGGGANIPAVTTSLSGRFGVPVITTPRPQLTAAIGGALRAARGPGDTSATTLTPAAPPPVAPPAPEPSAEEYQDVPAAAPVSAMQPALAWSEAQDESRLMPALASDSGSASGSGSGYTAARPQMKFEREERPEPEPKASPIPWYRLPAVIIISTVVAVLLVGTAVAIGLTSHEKGSKSPGVNTTPRSSAPPPATSESPSPEPPPASTPEPAPTTQAPAPRPQTQAPAPVQTTQAPPPTTEAPAPATTTVPPPATTTTPPVTTAPPVPQVPQLPGPANPNPPAPPPIPQIPQIPGLPQLPGIANVPAVPAVPGRLQAG
ncbi:hypothetical protein A9W98_29195 [Mycobacterium gordonae]|uniref:Molecular chaperone n=1 Tax=Mycobacterium gordonae TaxID=1778 RepID=A0A1A6BBL4_MYCGO|nr:Hsp70 family protein [Mycobacterium gordonae]MBI2698321.1 Hsp70 family protein [Mycobacterium sp.]OBR99628.1 hypothetical protein A9W98_29195 [Mycobacterium gordonae]